MQKKNIDTEKIKKHVEKLEKKISETDHFIRVYGRKRTLGQIWADRLTAFGGSWAFLTILTIIIALWILWNHFIAGNKAFDPYPFILMNLFLSLLAAYQAPIILMSQNREMERDRIKAERDYLINKKAEKEIQEIKADLEDIKKSLNKLLKGF